MIFRDMTTECGNKEYGKKGGFLDNLWFENLNSKQTSKSLNECWEDGLRSVLTCLEALGSKREI